MDMATFLDGYDEQRNIRYQVIVEPCKKRGKTGFFLGGNCPRKDGKIGKRCLSQWWASSFEIDDLWNEHRFEVAVLGNLAKFSQNNALQAFSYLNL